MLQSIASQPFSFRQEIAEKSENHAICSCYVASNMRCLFGALNRLVSEENRPVF